MISPEAHPTYINRLRQQASSCDWLDGRGMGSDLPDRKEMNARLQQVVDVFGLDWLMRDHDHPVAGLWKRDDPLATNELLLLGDSISKLLPVDSTWTIEQVRKAKGTNPSNRIGAQFELLAVASLQTAGQRVTPLKKDHPGCDALLSLRNGMQVYVSLKSFGASSFERSFRLRAQGIVDCLLQEMRQHHRNGVALVIVAEAYPAEADWQILRSAIAFLLGEHSRSGFSISVWSLYRMQLSGGEARLHEGHLSYQLTILAPYHKNEQKNLLDKLYQAAANLERHCRRFPAVARKGLFVRIPEDASAADCAEWAKAFYHDRAQEGVDFIFLYQVAVVQNLKQDTTGINHSVVAVPRDAMVFPLRNGADETAYIVSEFYVGTISRNPPRLILTPDPETPVRDAYVFQRGDIYRRAIVESGGVMKGQMHIFGDGILEHTVFSLDGKEVVFRGKYPRSNALMLFS